jgi:release factor glutamine methyltransferase
VIVKDVLDAAARSTADRGGEATSWDARLLLAHSVGHCRPLALDPREDLPAEAASRFEALWEKRLAGAPVQHLVGEWDFFGRPFFVDARALVPRPETELLVEAALAEAPAARRVLDLGTGSGILAVTWLLERPGSRAVAVDVSTDALALARANGSRHSVLERLGLVASDWTSALSVHETFDLAMSNPPYLALSDAAALSATVRNHDPASALFAGEDGLDACRQLLDHVPQHLAAGGPFLFEIGAGQADAVKREVAARDGWRLVRIVPDLAGIPRVAVLSRT